MEPQMNSTHDLLNHVIIYYCYCYCYLVKIKEKCSLICAVLENQEARKQSAAANQKHWIK